jgi:hypothetical protein
MLKWFWSRFAFASETSPRLAREVGTSSHRWRLRSLFKLTPSNVPKWKGTCGKTRAGVQVGFGRPGNLRVRAS